MKATKVNSRKLMGWPRRMAAEESTIVKIEWSCESD
jgi:hypothetical protein